MRPEGEHSFVDSFGVDMDDGPYARMPEAVIFEPVPR
jgi:hypothetical protein